MPAFLIPAAIGAAQAIYANQQKDPNEGDYKAKRKAARKKAASLREQADVDTASASVAALRNKAANVSAGMRTGAVSAGRGQSPMLAGREAALYGDVGLAEAGMRREDVQRRGALKGQATDVISGAEEDIAGSKSAYKSARQKAVMGGLVGGAQGAAMMGLSGMGGNKAQGTAEGTGINLDATRGYDGMIPGLPDLNAAQNYKKKPRLNYGMFRSPSFG